VDVHDIDARMMRTSSMPGAASGTGASMRCRTSGPPYWRIWMLFMAGIFWGKTELSRIRPVSFWRPVRTDRVRRLTAKPDRCGIFRHNSGLTGHRRATMKRRGFLQGLSLSILGSPLLAMAQAAHAATMKDIEALQKNWRALLAANFRAPLPTEPLKLSNAQWRQRLDAAQYKVLREEGTERAGSSPLNAEKRPGIYACAGCDLPLFTSEMKYESGTGWPSFFTTIPGVFGTKKDYLLVLPRTEYHCIRCGGHHGHVFDDGPPPTRQRWCNNGVALKFIPQRA
jgi:peptide-methionine (R)-S-oxide reductase